MAPEARRLFIKVSKIKIRTSIAFIIWALLLSGAFVFTGFKESAQFSTYATWITLGLTAYTGKRLFQRHAKLNGEKQ